MTISEKPIASVAKTPFQYELWHALYREHLSVLIGTPVWKLDNGVRFDPKTRMVSVRGEDWHLYGEPHAVAKALKRIVQEAGGRNG
jgi:hypothetical protein